MSFRYYYRDPGGEITELPDRFREAGVEFSSNAEEGSVGSCSNVADDPDGSLYVRGHRLFVVQEDEATGDDHNGVVWVGYTADRKFKRGSQKTDGGRDVTFQLTDLNTILDRRINVGKACDRPAETDLERIEWLLSTSETALITGDTTYIDTTDGVAMDKCNYEGQKVIDVIDDCSQQSGRNYFLLWVGGSGDGAPGDFTLWYKHSSSEDWASPIRICNILDEIDDVVTFAPAMDSELTRDPSRVYSGVYQDYDGGHVYEHRESTATRFARRDTTGIAENVKTEAKARARAKRYVRSIDTELDVITTAIILPRARVNDAMAGQRIQVKFSHFPGYTTDYVWMRIRDRTVRELNPFLVELALTLTGDAAGEGTATSNVFCTLDYAHGPFTDDLIRFGGSGDVPPIGWGFEPTVGPLTPLSDSHQRPYYGIRVDGDGTVDVEFRASTAGVSAGLYTVTWAITLNGSPVATVSKPAGSSAGLKFYHDGATVLATGLAVSDGDVLGATVTCAPVRMPFFKVPVGVGTGGERLAVTDGTLS